MLSDSAVYDSYKELKLFLLKFSSVAMNFNFLFPFFTNLPAIHFLKSYI